MPDNKEKPNYVQINRKVWNTSCFRALSKEARELFFYLTTCPHGNMIGIYILRPGYALDDLQLGLDRESFMKPLRELLDKHLFKYDEKTEIILDMEQLEKHPPDNPNQVKAALKIINSLPKTHLFQDLKQVAESLNKPSMKPFIERLAERYSKSVTETVTETVTELKEDATASPIEEHFELPSKEILQEASEPMILNQIEEISGKLYQEKIFPEAHAFKNKMIKDGKNPRSILHTLARAYLKKTFDEGPWGYCLNTILKESQNYNARDYLKST